MDEDPQIAFAYDFVQDMNLSVHAYRGSLG